MLRKRKRIKRSVQIRVRYIFECGCGKGKQPNLGGAHEIDDKMRVDVAGYTAYEVVYTRKIDLSVTRARGDRQCTT